MAHPEKKPQSNHFAQAITTKEEVNSFVTLSTTIICIPIMCPKKVLCPVLSQRSFFSSETGSLWDSSGSLFQLEHRKKCGMPHTDNEKGILVQYLYPFHSSVICETSIFRQTLTPTSFSSNPLIKNKHETKTNLYSA